MLVEHLYVMEINKKHIDSSNHVNNAWFMTFFEEARWDVFKDTPFNKGKMHSLGFAPVLIDCNIRYKKELLLSEKILIKTQVLSIEKHLIIHMKQVIVNQRGRLSCIAKIRHGLIDLEERCLINIKQEWLSTLLKNQQDPH